MAESRGGWRRAAALLAVSFLLSVATPTLLVAIPFALLALAVPPRRASTVGLAVGALVVIAGVGSQTSEWYMERGWALLLGGWFLALTLRWPASAFVTRALGAVAGSLAVALMLFLQGGGAWVAVDSLVWSRLSAASASALQAMRALQGGGELPNALVTAVERATDIQRTLFPSLLALASLAALGAAWWAYVRLARQTDQGLSPLPEFRFSDQLIWVLLLGVVLLIIPLNDGWQRAGTNAVVFMGALYALRGAAVVLFLSGGLSVLGTLAVAAALLFLAPVLLGGALVVGLGDTWLDLRRRNPRTA
ncbi:MAG: DUF2232 domain-containing protein [Gemmatimonadetes bacterium]|nr:DUF2232 domain-containing protein [Gemmatimonadota bacterium]